MLREARPIAAYCGADHAARLLASLAPGRLCQVEWFSSWNEFMAAAWGSCCVIVWIDRLDVSPEHAELSILKRTLPLVPLVLVTEQRWDNARHLKVVVDEVVWVSELESELTAAVSRAMSGAWRERVAHAVEKTLHLRPRVRRAIAEAMRVSKPPRTVAELARLGACDRRTLWEQWRDSGAPEAPHRLVDWLLLLGASERKRPGCKWERVADDLSISAATITRLARRLAGVGSRRELAIAGPAAVIAPFGERFLEPLLVHAIPGQNVEKADIFSLIGDGPGTHLLPGQ